MKSNKGITLIALVITIIVMLILVGVTISMAVNGGLFDYAGKAVGETKDALNAENELANGGLEVDGVWYSSINEYLNKDKERISKTESYVGYYADVDGNGTADGIIYADLAIGGSGEWNGGSYSYAPVTGVKDYYVSGTYNGEFQNGKEILKATGTGEDRFYVMALEDVADERYNAWYEVATLNVTSSKDFGTGRANTEALVTLWANDTNEAKNNNVVWGQIDSNSDWFVPSVGEWSAFLNEFMSYVPGEGIDFCLGFEQNRNYTTSSVVGWQTWFVDFSTPWMTDTAMADEYCFNYVRLSTTF